MEVPSGTGCESFTVSIESPQNLAGWRLGRDCFRNSHFLDGVKEDEGVVRGRGPARGDDLSDEKHRIKESCQRTPRLNRAWQIGAGTFS